MSLLSADVERLYSKVNLHAPDPWRSQLCDVVDANGAVIATATSPALAQLIALLPDIATGAFRDRVEDTNARVGVHADWLGASSG